jgi:helicase MOV-10
MRSIDRSSLPCPQASEPEAIVPIKGISGPRTNIILSGDQQQLRPVIRSAVAAELGLGKSLLERLMERAAYDRDNGRNRT